VIRRVREENLCAVLARDRIDVTVTDTEWDEFKRAPMKMFVERTKQPTIIDCKRLYDSNELAKAWVRFLATRMSPNNKKLASSVTTAKAQKEPASL